MHFITQTRLDHADYDVTRDLLAHGFYDLHVHVVDTHLVPFGIAHGWPYYGSNGDINIPRVSILRLCEIWRGYHG